MQTKREYLIGLGLAKPGRGKFSREGVAAIAKAEAEGMVFADNKPVPTAPKPTAAPVVNDPGNSQYLTSDDYRFPEAEYHAYSFVDGKKVKVSLRECCNLCRVSLVNHGCDAPTILGNIVVKIERR